MDVMKTRNSSRRTFLQAGGMAALSACVGLTGCSAEDAGAGKDGSSPSTMSRSRSSGPVHSGSNAQVELPDYKALDVVQPDLPGNAETGLLPYYAAYPDPPVRVVTSPPGSGGTVTALSSIATPVPPSADRNPMWRLLNQDLGVDFKINFVADNYSDKLATTIAGGDLPDIVGIVPQPHLPEVLAAEFQDLSDFLSGDAIHDYPALANIPSYCWPYGRFGGRIYCIPGHRPLSGQAIIARQDIRTSVGLGDEVASGADFAALCRGVTDAKQHRWAGCQPVDFVTFYQEMLGAPNVWAESGGAFTSAYEAPETEQALGEVRKLWKDGVFHPDSFATLNSSRMRTWFINGTVVMLSWTSHFESTAGQVLAANPKARVAAVPPPDFDGNGAARQFLGTGVGTITAIKKGDRAHTEEMLRILNWLCTPFGSQERVDLVFGVKGRDYTLSGTNPVKTEVGRSEFVPATQLATMPIVHYDPGYPDLAKDSYDYEKRVLESTAPLPTAGLYSDTDQAEGAVLTKKMTDVQGDIIQGRKSMSAWKEAVATWRSSGGDKIRREYQTAFAAARAGQ